MDPCGRVNTAAYNVHGPVDSWTQDRFSGRFTQPQILDPELSGMYDTPNHSHPVVSEYTTDAPTPSYSPSPSGMTTPSESSNFPSPTDSALSPFFLDAPTPTSPTSEPVVKKPSHSRKRPPGHIPRPRNAFILFRSHYVAAQLIPGKVENDHRHISKIIGEIWNKLSPSERLIWEQKADIEKERHSRKYPGYRYKPVKLDGAIKRRVKCRGAPASSAYSTTPGIGKTSGAHEIIGSLNADEGGRLHFGNGQGPRLIDQEERRKDRARCARVAELVQQGIVGERLEAEAQRLGLDRESVASTTPQLQPSIHDPPGRRTQFHTNTDILRALREEDSGPAFTNPFALDNPSIHRQDSILPLDSIITSSALSSYYSPAQTYTSFSGENEDVPAAPAPATVPTEVNITLGEWPPRRASSLPSGIPLLASPVTSERHRPVVSQVQQLDAAPATTGPTRPSSSSPLRRQHRLYYPYPRPRAQMKQADGDLDSDSDLSTFDHVSYYSPANSPPEQYLSPHVRPSLQLDSAARHSGAASPISHPNTMSPLYGIDSAHSGRPHEPIDLSAMYDEQDNATGHEATLHSTYAINAGKGYSPIPATPAPLSDVPISQRLALTCKPVHDHATSSGLDIESGPSPAYYGWQSPYGSELNYPQGSEYDASTDTVTYGEIQHMYYSNDTGGPSY